MMNGKREEILSASLLINELCDQDVEKRINAVSSLRSIGTALGNIRIRNQLLPFLKEELVDDQAKVILALLTHLPVLGEIMAGGGIGYTYLFPLLEEIIQNQEEKVRDKALSTFFEVVEKCNVQKYQNQVMNCLKNILNFDFQQAKEGFVLVVGKKLGKFSPQNQQFLLNQYQAMAQGSCLPLRKYTAKYSKYLAEWLPENEAGILKIVEILFKDKEESHKIFLIDAILSLAKFKNHTFLQPYFNLISYQFTWRVRYELISKIDLLAETLGSVDKFKPFLTYFIKYINDIQPEIRSISCLKLGEVIKFVSPEDTINRVIPALKNIPQDSNIYVRNSLASSLLTLCAPIGKKNTSELILPKFLQLLKDDEVQVRLTMFSKIDDICSVLGAQTLSHTTVPALNQLATSPNWRIRVSSMDLLFYLIQKSGGQFVNEKMIKLVYDYLGDKANVVRREATKLLVKIIEQLGSGWVQKNLMQKILQISKAKSYIQRETFLDIVDALIPFLSQEFTSKNINSLIVNSFCRDPIDNVRISVCKVLKNLYKYSNEKQLMKKSLRILIEDKDRDVKQMATKTFKQLDS